MLKTMVTITALWAVCLFATTSAQAAVYVDGSVFSDDFPGSALGSHWTTEIGGAGSATVASSVVTFDSVGGGYPGGGDYASIWGSSAYLSGLGSSTDWGAEVRFKVPGHLFTIVAGEVASPYHKPRNWRLLDGRVAGDQLGRAIDLRVLKDGTGADGATYSLGWAGDDWPDNDLRDATVIATLNKDQWYTAVLHRKSDGNVDIYLDDSLISTQSVLSVANPDFFRLGDGGSYVGGIMEVDYIKAGGFVPEPATLAVLAIGGLMGLLSRKRRKQR